MKEHKITITFPKDRAEIGERITIIYKGKKAIVKATGLSPESGYLNGITFVKSGATSEELTQVFLISPLKE